MGLIVHCHGNRYFCRITFMKIKTIKVIIIDGSAHSNTLTETYKYYIIADRPCISMLFLDPLY